MRNFGSLLGLCLITQILTGLFLAIHYCGDASLAFSRASHICRDVNYGWILRIIHANGARFIFALTKGPTETVGPTHCPPISSSRSPVVLCPLRSFVCLWVSILKKRLGAGHNAANVVDTAGVVGSHGVGVSSIWVGGVGDGSNGSRGSSLHLNLGSRGSNDVGTSGQVGVGTVGVRVGGVSDGRCGNNGDGLLVDVGLCNIACGIMDVSLGFRGGSISNVTSGIMDIRESCRGIINSDIASGVMDIGESLRGLHALLRDGAGKSQGNGRQEN